MPAEPLIGIIKMFGGNFAPRGWAFCNGQLLPISQNTALFAIIGTLYGGDGRVTFGLPDMRDRAPMHAGNGPGLSPRTIGQKFGQATVALSVSTMPSHTHQLSAHAVVADTDVDPPGATTSLGAIPGSEAGIFFPNLYGADTGALVDMANDALTATTGGGAAHENRQPFQGINFIIALVGIFPSSN